MNLGVLYVLIQPQMFKNIYPVSLITQTLRFYMYHAKTDKEIKSPPDKGKTRPLAEAFPDQTSLAVKKT